MERAPKSRSQRDPRHWPRWAFLGDLQSHFPNIAQPLLLDERYYCPTLKDLDHFGREILEWLDYFELTDQDGRFLWDEDFDCEDVSILALALAKIKHLRTKLRDGSVSKGSPALGLICYDRQNDQGMRGHALLAVRLLKGWFKLEPQTGRNRPFEPHEQFTAWGFIG